MRAEIKHVVVLLIKKLKNPDTIIVLYKHQFLLLTPPPSKYNTGSLKIELINAIEYR